MENNKKTVLITGCNGFLGKNLAKAFHAKDYEVMGLDLQIKNAPEWMQVVAADITKQEELQNAFDDLATQPEIIIHTAGLLIGQADDETLMKVNVKGTQNLLSLLPRKIQHFIFLSSSMVYGSKIHPGEAFVEDHGFQPDNMYGRSKAYAEEAVIKGTKNTNCITTIFRPSVLYGDGASSKMLISGLVHALAEGEPFPSTAGEQLRDFLYIDDAVNAIVQAANQRIGGVFNLSYGQSVSLREVLDSMAQISGKPELIQKGKLPYRDNEVFHYALSSDKFQKVSGWKPQTNLQQGLQKFWHEYNGETL